MTAILPERMRRLPVVAGMPVPAFVHWVDNIPDFRLSDPYFIAKATRQRLCWVCGQPLGSIVAYIVGPVGAINRISAEPPSHTECARYSAQTCPFLANPNRERRVTNLPGHTDLGGVMLDDNPGVVVVWITRRTRTRSVPDGLGGIVYDVGEPVGTTWYRAGRFATRDEVLAGFASGVCTLRTLCEAEGVDAVQALNRRLSVALALIPAD